MLTPQLMCELFAAAAAAQPAKQTAAKAAAPAKQAQQAASDAASSAEKPSRDLLGSVFSGIRLPWQQGNGAKQQQVMPFPLCNSVPACAICIERPGMSLTLLVKFHILAQRLSYLLLSDPDEMQATWV